MVEGQITSENLKDCTVKLSLEGYSSDLYVTGFLISPALILTCAHIVIAKALEKSINVINVHWHNQLYRATLEKVPEDSKTLDFALLRLTAPIPHAPYVSLEESVQEQDILHNFGYPDAHKVGEPSTFHYIGCDGGNPPLLKFTQDRVRSGLSGSPLLNARTGKVCGIVTWTRDRDLSLGGWAIPISTVFQEFPELRPSTPQPSPNPFPLGTIDDPSLLFDREKDLQGVFDILNSGGNVALMGEKGVGKSSLLRTIEQQATEQLKIPRKSIYLPLSQVFNEEDFYFALCDLMEIEQSKGFRFYRCLKQQRILLLMDEVEEMEWEGLDKQTRSQLRGLANDGNVSPLRLVVATRTPLTQLFADSGIDSPFENICIDHTISCWGEEQVRKFINHRLQSTSIRFSEREIMQIAVESGGNPSKVVQKCYNLYKKYQTPNPP